MEHVRHPYRSAAKNFLYLSNLALDFAANLFRAAPVLCARIAGRAAGLFLHFACNFFRSSFGAVFCARFHLKGFRFCEAAGA